MTIDEMCDELKLKYKTVHKRLETLGIKPISYKALYDPSALEAIRNVPNRGRPTKAKPEPEKPLKGKAKSSPKK